MKRANQLLLGAATSSSKATSAAAASSVASSAATAQRWTSLLRSLFEPSDFFSIASILVVVG